MSGALSRAVGFAERAGNAVFSRLKAFVQVCAARPSAIHDASFRAPAPGSAHADPGSGDALRRISAAVSAVPYYERDLRRRGVPAERVVQAPGEGAAVGVAPKPPGPDVYVWRRGEQPPSTGYYPVVNYR